MEENQKEADASFFVLKTKSEVTKRNIKQKRHWQSRVSQLIILIVHSLLKLALSLSSHEKEKKKKEKIFKKRIKKVKKGLDEGEMK